MIVRRATCAGAEPKECWQAQLVVFNRGRHCVDPVVELKHDGRAATRGCYANFDRMPQRVIKQGHRHAVLPVVAVRDVFPDEVSVVDDGDAVITIVGPLIEADGHALCDAVLANAAGHVVSAHVDTKAVCTSAVAAVHEEAHVEGVLGTQRDLLERCPLLGVGDLRLQW